MRGKVVRGAVMSLTHNGRGDQKRIRTLLSAAGGIERTTVWMRRDYRTWPMASGKFESWRQPRGAQHPRDRRDL